MDQDAWRPAPRENVLSICVWLRGLRACGSLARRGGRLGRGATSDTRLAFAPRAVSRLPDSQVPSPQDRRLYKDVGCGM
jgi:hypothetical protein